MPCTALVPLPFLFGCIGAESSALRSSQTAAPLTETESTPSLNRLPPFCSAFCAFVPAFIGPIWELERLYYLWGAISREREAIGRPERNETSTDSAGPTAFCSEFRAGKSKAAKMECSDIIWECPGIPTSDTAPQTFRCLK